LITFFNEHESIVLYKVIIVWRSYSLSRTRINFDQFLCYAS